ncbi:LamG-like jellyroll fold domain-containing protein [Streptomyces sp. NPDC020422]|uniref:LamG-like jellyroll fold domain-containing protein n=1 Tax=Streptomyces sp. NPDC020422 TaxID=3365074 RepID=UPI0037AC1225
MEIASLRTESSEVFVTPEGDLEARQHLRPVRARIDGKWQQVDTTLAKSGDGAVVPKATTVGLEFSGGGTAPLVRMTKAGRELALSWPDKLPAPELEGSMATYRDVLPDVDLRMGAQEDGFTQLLVVKTAEAASSERLTELRLKLAADGMDVRQTSDGGLEAVDEGAKSAVFAAPKPMMWDSSEGESAVAASGARTMLLTAADAGGDEAGATGEPAAGESGKLAAIGVELPSGGDELVLKPDPEVLKGDDTKYPVFIDPQWYSPRASAWTMASKYWASSPQWKFNGDPDAGMGYCGWAYCAPQDTKRLFYQIPTSRFAGQSILSAEFVVRNVHSASCSAREVQLWRTKGISSSTTWNSQLASGYWIKQIAKGSFAYGYDGCSAKDAEFDVKAAVQEAANGSWSSMTFGLRSSDESDAYGWKRFSDDAYLRVKYNRPPAQIKTSQLLMEYGGTCATKTPARVRTLGKIYLDGVTDPDGDNIAVDLEAKWDAGDGKGFIVRWNPPLTTYKASGSDFALALPSVPANKTVHWYARSFDGAQYSPWSFSGGAGPCQFVYDTLVPKGPKLTSREYPASDSSNPDDPWLEGVGRYGVLTADAVAADPERNADVVKYWFGLNEDPTSKNTVSTSGGAARPWNFMPSKPGVNYLQAQAFDSAGNGSEVVTYQFRVKVGQPERASWQLNEAEGATTAEGTTPPRTVQLHGGAALGAPGKKNGALQLDGMTGYAVSDISTVDTADSFSVSAWAKLDRLPSTAAIIATQPGNHRPGFELYYSAYANKWVFNQYSSDSTSGVAMGAGSATPGDAKPGEWAHLVGVHDKKAGYLRLYVNGQLAGSTPYTTPWEARRGLQLGAGMYSGSQAGFFPGAIDDVQVFDRAVTADEAKKLSLGGEADGSRLARAQFPLDEAADSTETVGQAAPEPLTLQGGATTGAEGMAGKALGLNGTTAYASTTHPVLDTSRSYAVSAWAYLPTTTVSGNRTVVSQSGTNCSAFYLTYEAVAGNWSLRTCQEDVSPGNITTQRVLAQKPATAGWTHLVGVHDVTAHQIRLYVNGELQGGVAAPKAWESSGAVQIGRARWSARDVDYFSGRVDDVRLYDRPLADGEVLQLFKQRPLVNARWNFEAKTGTVPVTIPNEVKDGAALTLEDGAAQSTDSQIDFGSLNLDGIKSYAHTKAPVDTSGSYTVTAWAKLAALPQDSVSVVSAEGTNQSAFTVRFVPDTAGIGRWELALQDKDAADAKTVRVSNNQFFDATSWNHLAVVYNGFGKQARLYVNGNLEQVACVDSDGDGNPDVAGCEDRVSWSDNALTFKASTSLQIGRAKTNGVFGEYFPGVVDDVWAFQGALNDSQVQELANSMFDIPTQVPGGS